MPFTKGHKLNVGNKFRLGIKHTEEWKDKARARMSGNTNGFKKGQPSPRKGKKLAGVVWNKGLRFPQNSGENHWNWKSDRSQLKRQDRKDNPDYKRWRQAVWERDNYRCCINTGSCHGKIQAHHIYRFSDYPTLRYVVDNGITVCQRHHPIRKAEEQLLANMFLDIIGSNLPRSN